MILKRNSEAWQIAKKISKRKGCNYAPIELLHNGSVKMQSLIRGNTWIMTIDELKAKYANK